MQGSRELCEVSVSRFHSPAAALPTPPYSPREARTAQPSAQRRRLLAMRLAMRVAPRLALGLALLSALCWLVPAAPSPFPYCRRERAFWV
jgi:hypothetical protein